MTSESFVKEEAVTGFGQVPNGLWTADMTHGAKALLGWLWSHEQSYLAKLGTNRCEREFGGGGACREWLSELQAKGYLTMTLVGGRTRITLLADPWLALHDRDVSRRAGKRRGAAPDSVAPTATESAPLEDHLLEDHLEHHLPAVPAPVSFDAFWTAYPRKAGKVSAVKAWTKLKAADRNAAIAALPQHVTVWRAQKRGMDKVPHAATWLNQRRWEDDLRDETRVAPSAGDNPFLTILREGNQLDP